MSELPQFPEGFLWGADSAAFQVEGALDADGRRPSVWDDFGPIANGDTARVATDHYHRYQDDVALMRELGLPAYRFSIAWPRVFPSGGGALNEPGLAFYERLVDELLAAGVEPVPTLFHWDTPRALEDAGGWLNRDTVYRLADYAAAAVARLGDRVRRWITINEPAEHTLLGYGLGSHAPGKRLLFDALPVAHHLLLGHGLTVQALRAGGAPSIGMANSHGPVWPASDSEADRFSADLYDMLMNWLFADPILRGSYPDDGLAAAMPGPVADDLKIISSPVDWYGVNYYQPALVGAPGDASVESLGGIDIPSNLPFGIRDIDGYPRTDFGWPVVPDALHEVLLTLRDRYSSEFKPVIITENGCSYGDVPDQSGRVRDARRVRFMDEHIRAVHRAITDGVDVRGYFAWSLTDNFEWAAGYAQRFGLIHVDYQTLRRTPKDSFYWYQSLLRTQRSN
jgi:beta-glucosidase